MIIGFTCSLLRLTLRIAGAFAPGIVFFAALMSSPAGAQAPCPSPIPIPVPPPNLDAPAATQVPQDVCIPQGFPGNPIAYFDDYSWRTFIALVWPALNGQRGMPDPSLPLTATGANLVFETYKADWETFQPNGTAPSAFNSAESYWTSNPAQSQVAFRRASYGRMQKTLQRPPRRSTSSGSYRSIAAPPLPTFSGRPPCKPATASGSSIS
jgi:hypothetical protein